MSARSDARHNEEQANSWRKAEIDEASLELKADIWWVRKHFGEKIKMTGYLVMARTSEEFLKEIDRQNQKIARGEQ